MKPEMDIADAIQAALAAVEARPFRVRRYPLELPPPRSYAVDERGPELFVPESHVTVIPNAAAATPALSTEPPE